MAFHVYPDPQAGPLPVPALGTQARPFTELAAVDPATSLNTMFIRVVKLGGACAPTGAVPLRFRLKAGAGDFTSVLDVPPAPAPIIVPPGTARSIFNGPGDTGTEVANAIVTVEANDVY